METKRDIRKGIFSLRKACTEEQVREMSRIIGEKVVSLPEFSAAEKIYVYADYNHEVMTGYIIEEAWKRGKQVAVPRVEGQDMVFCLLEDFSRLKPGYFGIPEPEEGEAVLWEDALIIMPGVAFDRENHRVGYGGGFYDRFLEKHPCLRRMALAFQFQILPSVPAEPTDICPEILVTEKEILRRVP